MTLYIYRVDNMELIAMIHGETNKACEDKAEALGLMNRDDWGDTYSPAFGTVHGVVTLADTPEFFAEAPAR